MNNTGINLLGAKRKGAARPFVKRLLLMRLVAMTTLFLVSVFSVVLSILITLSPLPQLRRQEANEIQVLSQAQNDIAKLSVLNERMNTIMTLLAHRSGYDGILSTIQTYFPNGLFISGFSLGHDTLSITVSGTSLEQMDIFINTIVGAVQEKKNFSHVTLSSLSLDSQTNTFVLTLLLQPL